MPEGGWREGSWPEPRRARFQPNDVAITPSDEVAFVVAEPTAEGFVDLRYRDALRRDHAMATVHESLLVRWDDGKPRPRPVRVARVAQVATVKQVAQATPGVR